MTYPWVVFDGRDGREVAVARTEAEALATCRRNPRLDYDRAGRWHTAGDEFRTAERALA